MYYQLYKQYKGRDVEPMPQLYTSMEKAQRDGLFEWQMRDPTGDLETVFVGEPYVLGVAREVAELLNEYDATVEEAVEHFEAEAYYVPELSDDNHVVFTYNVCMVSMRKNMFGRWKATL